VSASSQTESIGVKGFFSSLLEASFMVGHAMAVDGGILAG
jgi:hypothetical protein